MIVKLLKPLSFVPALLLMYMIYSFSAQDAETSSALSYEVSYTMVEAGNVVLDAGLQPNEISSLATRFNGVVRKLAHMTEYFALAIAVAFPLYVYGLHWLPLMFVAGLFCVAFACTDEYHQSFVSGRGSTVRDVLIDSFGIFWGIILVRIIGWTGRKTIFRPFGKKKKKAGNETAASEEYYDNRNSVYPPRNPDNQPYQGQQAHRGQQAFQSRQPYQNQQAFQNGQPYQNQQIYQGSQPNPNSQTYQDRQTSPYQQGYTGSQPYPAYGYNGDPDTNQKKQKKKRQNNSDRLSEDMSLKKLMRDLTNKKEDSPTN